LSLSSQGHPVRKLIMNGSSAQEPPVLNLWTEVPTAEAKNSYPNGVQFVGLEIEQINDEAAAKNVGLRITIRNSDGINLVTLTSASPESLDSATPELWRLGRVPQTAAASIYAIDSDISITMDKINLGIESDYLKVETRLESAAGTNQKINCHLIYEKVDIQ